MSVNNYKDTVVYKVGQKVVRSTKHEFKNYINVNKDGQLISVIKEYRTLMTLCIHEFWDIDYRWKSEKTNNVGRLYLSKGIIEGNLPQHLNVTLFRTLDNYKGLLSGRMVSQMLRQMVGIIRGLVKSVSALSNNEYSIPDISKINVEIAPKNLEIINNTNENSYFTHYVVFINLISTKHRKFKKREAKIYVPIRLTPMDTKYINRDFNKLNGCLLTETGVDLRYHKSEDRFAAKKDKKKSKKVLKRVVGADQGIKTLLTISDKQVTSNKDDKGKDFQELYNKINRKQKHSNAKKRAIKELKDCIRYNLNKLNFNNFETFRFESNKGLKKNTQNANHFWSTMTIMDSILRKCQDNHVDLTLTPSFYKSHRCNKCGFVHYSNRSKEDSKKFKCLYCKHEADADYVAACNNELEFTFDNELFIHTAKYYKSEGFFWFTNGVFDRDQFEKTKCIP